MKHGKEESRRLADERQTYREAETARTQENARRRREDGGGLVLPYLEHVFAEDGRPIVFSDGQYKMEPADGATKQDLFEAVLFAALVVRGDDYEAAADKAADAGEAMVKVWNRRKQ